ncbi:MAG TPA: glycosyltransferase, partial [Chloroflexota bacterium]|nr:glycosyltransferase [Chloroflexota bacterium]
STLTFVTLAICWLLYGMPFAGYGSIVSLVLLVLGVLSLMLGVVAEYIGLIYEEVKQRPIYLVSEEYDPTVESQEPLV